MKKLLLTGAFKYTIDQLSELESLGYKIIFIENELEELNIDVSDIEVVVCNSLFLYNDISKFKKLKYIQLTSAGYDRVPLDYIRKNNIFISNARGVYSIPIAEWIILKILEIYKSSFEFYTSQRKHEWKKRRNLLELTEKNVAILGYGNIGKEVAKRLRAFGCNITAFDKENPYCDLINKGFSIKEIKKEISDYDIIISTLPLTIETKHFIDSELIKKFKDKCVFINVSRGEVVKENDLIESIKNNKFLGVALDVFEQEPLSSGSLLWELEGVYITPHNSFISDQVNKRLYQVIYHSLKKGERDERCSTYN